MNGYQIDIQKEHAEIDRELALATATQNALPRIAEAFAKIPAENVFFCYVYASGKIICHVKTRADFAHIRALHVGKWDKRIDEQSVSPVAEYEADPFGIKIIARVSELPPSCRIVTEVIPEHTVPATTKHKVVCDGGAK